MNENNIWSGWRLIQLDTQHKVGHLRRKSKRAAERKKHQIQTLRMINDDYPGLISGDKNVIVNNQDVEKWVVEIGKSSSPVVLRDKHNFLSNGLSKGIEILDWQVEPIPLITKIPSGSGVSFTAFERQFDFQLAIASHNDLLCEPLWLSNPLRYLQEQGYNEVTVSKILWGQILFTAAIYGGILEKSTLFSLVHTHNNNIIKLKESDNCWITFYESRTKPDWLSKLPPRKRWYLDESTYLLLGAWQKSQLQQHVPPETLKYKRKNTRWHNQCLRNFSKAIGIESMDCTQLLQNATTFWQNKLPNDLITNCNRTGQYTALPTHIMELMIRDCSNPNQLISKNSTPSYTARKKGHENLINNIESLKPSFSALNLLKKALYQGDGTKTPARHELDQLFAYLIELNHLTPIAWSIISWLQHHHKKNKPRTVYTYLTMVGPVLIDLVGGATLCDDNKIILSTAYQTIIEEASTPSRAIDKYNRLRDFQSFLHSALGGPKINIDDFVPSSDITPQASANMVSEYQYIRIRNYLAAQNSSEENILLHLIFIILYRSGCRISEILTVKLRDLQWTTNRAGELLLHINSNEFGSTKSPAAVRRIPLHLTLDDKEKILFFNYLDSISLTRKNSSFLFSLDHIRSIPMPEETVRLKLQHAMRGLTGNLTLTLHHLRHSFANHVFAALLDINLPFSTPDHYKRLKSLSIFERSYLYLLADLMGHTSPKITISSYIHIMDWTLRCYLSKYSNIKSGLSLLPWQSIILEQEGIRPEILRKRLQRCPDDLFCSCSNRNYYPNTTIIHTDLIKPSKAVSFYVPNQDRPLDQLDLETATELLRLIEDKEDHHEIIEILQLEHGAILATELAIVRVMMIKNKRNGYRHIHPYNNKYKGLAKDGFKSEQLNRTLHILRPPIGENLKIARSVFNQLKLQLETKFDSTCDVTIKMMKIFNSNFRVTENYLRFTIPEQAGQFTQWIQSILPEGIVHLDLKIAPSNCHGAMTVRDQINNWRDHTCLSITDDNISSAKNSENTISGTADLSVFFKGTTNSCYGYRYAISMMMTLITAQYFSYNSKTRRKYLELILQSNR